MDVFTIDFETYYDKDYSLRKMSTEDYVNDDRFQIIMVGIKCNDEPTEVFSFKRLEDYASLLRSKGVCRGAVLCHNTMFDGLILTARLGLTCRMYLDTLAMAQCLLKPYHRSISLAACLKAENSPFSKGSAVHDMVGRRLESLTKQEYSRYATYCTTDVDSEYWLFNQLKPRLPKDEFLIIDMTLRMYLEPQFDLDYDTLHNVYRKERDNKKTLLSKLPDHIDQSELTSNPKFAALLEKLGVEVPYKISPVTDKLTYAFSKNDPEWKDMELAYSDNALVSALLAARLGVKSTIGETRARRFLDIADKYGKLRVPLRYYGAHTGRYSGMEKINCQNLPRIPRGSDHRSHLRYALAAPEGMVVLASDLSQIEARLNAWVSGCNTLLSVFRDRGDPYCAFASRVFNRPITKADEVERFIGKTCVLGLGYGMGWTKLQATLRKDGMITSDSEAARYVQVYRDVYCEIPELWRTCDTIISEMVSGETLQMIGPVCATRNRVTLPNGLWLAYDNLRFINTQKYSGFAFDWGGRTKRLWGGIMVENIIQALARIVVSEHMVKIRKELGLRPVLQAHDEIVYIVPEDKADDYKKSVLEIMTTPPEFAPDLPIDAEAAWGKTYGDAK